jgi:hypothetical protein
VYGSSALGGSVSYAGSTGTGQYQNNYGGGVTTTSQNHTKLSSALNTGTKEAQVKEACLMNFTCICVTVNAVCQGVTIYFSFVVNFRAGI